MVPAMEVLNMHLFYARIVKLTWAYDFDTRNEEHRT
jgi:hypothetical protein